MAGPGTELSRCRAFRRNWANEALDARPASLDSDGTDKLPSQTLEPVLRWFGCTSAGTRRAEVRAAAEALRLGVRAAATVTVMVTVSRP